MRIFFQKEKNYLLALNPSLRNLSIEEINRYATDSLINENVKIYDNNSTNGVYINGNLIQNHASIKSGDQLQKGKFQLLFTKV